MEIIFTNTIYKKTNHTHKFVLNLFIPNKHVALQNLSIYYTWNNIRKQYKNKKPKIIAPWHDEFYSQDGSYYIILHILLKSLKHYINRINNRLVFKIKDGYRLELQTPETMKLFCNIKNSYTKQKLEKKYLVLNQQKQFQSNVIQQIININKSLKNYTILPQIVLMLIW